MLSKLQPSKNRQGQSITEYLILTALLGIGSIAVIQILGVNLRKNLSNIANTLAGHSENKLTGDKVDQKFYNVQDLGNFQDAIKTPDDH